MTDSEAVRVLSVRDLVRRRIGADVDRWHLALVQRAEVWDHVRMRYLLDSLLAGYPVGSLLVCQVTGQSRIIRVEEGQRTTAQADPNAWQLLDGQQRINALFSLFTGQGDYGRFYLDMTMPREPAGGPVTGRRARDQGLAYIHWQDAEEPDAVVPERANRIDLSRWYEWAEADGGELINKAGQALRDSASPLSILNQIDSDFRDDLNPSSEPIARERLERLIELWREPIIPVQYLELASPLDVLEVFTRINRAGVQVAGQDLFFAAVKTLWNEAEQVLARISDDLTPRSGEDRTDALVGRMEILRILARLAARAVGQADLVPLTIDRLTGERGDAVIDVMRQMGEPGSRAVARMERLTRVLVGRSVLGFGLYSVDDRLWDHVLGWAAVSAGAEREGWLSQNVEAIDGYLVGATAFRYASVLANPFSRIAMTESLAAGVEGRPFPAERIAAVARGMVPTLAAGRQRIRGIQSDEDRLHLADANASLFLSILQSIEYRPQLGDFDWDHIYPQAQATRMWSPGPGGKWRRHHKYRRFVNSAGNLWALDAGTNKAVQDKLPREKFQEIDRLASAGKRPIWAPERWWLTPDEIAVFNEVGKRLEAGDRKESAMRDFHKLVTDRARRMSDEVLRRLPNARLFAADVDLGGADARPDVPIAQALGVDVAEIPSGVSARQRIESTRPSDERSNRLERVLVIADEAGLGSALRRFVDSALSVGLQVRPYVRSITVTPPSSMNISLIAMTPDAQRGAVRIWVAPSGFARHFPAIPAERFDQALGGLRDVMLGPGEVDSLGELLRELLGPPSE